MAGPVAVAVAYPLPGVAGVDEAALNILGVVRAGAVQRYPAVFVALRYFHADSAPRHGADAVGITAVAVDPAFSAMEDDGDDGGDEEDSRSDHGDVVYSS